jgi:hypothetical protein
MLLSLWIILSLASFLIPAVFAILVIVIEMFNDSMLQSNFVSDPSVNTAYSFSVGNKSIIEKRFYI